MWLNIGVFLLVAILVGLYFFPYRKVKDKIFKKVLSYVERINIIEYTHGKQQVTLVRKRVDKRAKSEWFVASHIEWPADISKVNRLLMRLRDMVLEERITDYEENELSDKYDMGRNGTLALTYKNGKQITLTLGDRVANRDDAIYAMTSDSKGVVVANNAIVSALPKSVDEFKSLYLFMGKFSQVTLLSVQSDAYNYTLMRTGGGWAMHDRNIFDDRVRPLITEILDMEAGGFIERSTKLPAKPAVTITIKLGGKMQNCYFFDNEDDNSVYLVPHQGEILVMNRTLVQDIVQFK